MASDDHQTHEEILARLRASDGSTTDVVMSSVEGFKHVFKHIERLEQRIKELEEKKGGVDGGTY